MLRSPSTAAVVSGPLATGWELWHLTSLLRRSRRWCGCVASATRPTKPLTGSARSPHAVTGVWHTHTMAHWLTGKRTTPATWTTAGRCSPNVPPNNTERQEQAVRRTADDAVGMTHVHTHGALPLELCSRHCPLSHCLSALLEETYRENCSRCDARAESPAPSKG